MKFFDLLKNKKYYNCARFGAYALVVCLGAWFCFFLISSSITDSKYASPDKVHTTTPFKTITAPSVAEQHIPTVAQTTSQTETTVRTAPQANDKFFGNFIYKVEEFGVSITGYEGRTSIIEIPSIIKGKSVVEIKGGVFKNNSYVEKVIIPAGVQKIGSEAFYSCENLAEVVLPEGLIDIGDGAFSCCVKLKNINIPNSVTNIGLRAFEHCVSLENVTLSSGITSIHSATFSNCKKLETITIPIGVTKIGYNAFYNCKNLKQIIIPETVTQIDESAFIGCDSLELN